MGLTRIAENKVRSIALVFAVALAIRLIYCFTSFQGYLNNDSVGFHNIAVNVVQGNSYSADAAPPYNPNFLREPGYPMFLAGVYALYSIVGEPHHIQPDTMDVSQHPEIAWARVAQAILGAATCALFLLLLQLRLRPTASLVLALLASAYLPLAAFSAILLRETLQTFLVMAMSYTVARFLFQPRWSWLALFTVAWALSNLTLQVTLLAIAPVFVFFWIWSRKFWRSVGYAAVAGLAMLVLVSPWLIRTYNFYPDVRIVRSMGMSLTMESVRYVATQFSLYKSGVLPRDTVYSRVHREVWDVSERERFDRSYSGYYDRETAKARELLGSHGGLSATLKQLLSYARNCWVESLWIVELPDGNFDMGPHGVYRAQKQYLLFALSLVGFLFGYAAIIGIPLFFRRLFPLLPMFTYFVLLIPVIGDEERRGLAMHPFIVLFSCLTFFYFYGRLVRKRTHAEVFSALFQPSTVPPVPTIERIPAPAMAQIGS
jgi:hypothetical protein